MRTTWLAGAMFVMAVAGCDDVAFDGVDAADLTDATASIDAGADGAAAVAIPARAHVAPAAPATIDRAMQAPPSLVELTSISGRLAMVLDLGEGQPIGPIARVHARGQSSVVLRRGHRPSEDEQELLGKTVRLYERSGGTCTASVHDFAEVASIIPAEHSDAGLGELWRIADERGGITVLAELSAAGCRAPIFADEELQFGPAAAPVKAPFGSAVETVALARLRALPRFAATQAAYQADPNHDPSIADWSEGADATVTELTLDGASYVTAELHTAGECGNFGATIFAIWQRGADGAYRLVVDSDTAPAGYDLAFDADHDGVPELAAATTIEPVEEEHPFEGCGC